MFAVLGFLLMFQSLFVTTLLAGTLSDPTTTPCVNGTQWLLYDCKRNPWTGFGCISPGSDGRSLTYKTSAVKVSPCQSQFSGTRVISFQWVEYNPGPDNPGKCVTDIFGSTCCEYNASCTRAVTYYCQSTGQGDDGESRCVPQFLPVPYPQYNPNLDYTDKANRFTLHVPCRENYCSAKP